MFEKRPPHPPVPNPNVDADEVHHYLVNWFLCNDKPMPYEEVDKKAAQIYVDGRGLYALEKEKWVAKFDYHGELIFKELNESKYGFVGFSSGLFVLNNIMSY